MFNRIKTIIKRLIPPEMIDAFIWSMSSDKINRAKDAFNESFLEPEWLTMKELEYLQRKYPLRETPSYDNQTRIESAEKFASELITKAGTDSPKLTRYLELGCQEGFVCQALAKLGKNVTGIDIDYDQFADAVTDSGIELHNMSASYLEFPDESFDFVFSQASFEHFDKPEAALKEAIRVTRKDGYIYLNFGPLYFSPLGLHAYASITVPYCQLLFPIEMIKEFCRKHDLRHKEFIYVNGWSYKSYCELFDKYSNKLEKVKYSEKRTFFGVELIERYPSCFRSKTDSFDDLLVDSIDVLFRKK